MIHGISYLSIRENEIETEDNKVFFLLCTDQSYDDQRLKKMELPNGEAHGVLPFLALIPNHPISGTFGNCNYDSTVITCACEGIHWRNCRFRPLNLNIGDQFVFCTYDSSIAHIASPEFKRIDLG